MSCGRSRDDVVYAWDWATTADCWPARAINGALLAIDARGVFAQLAKAGSAQITGIVSRARRARSLYAPRIPERFFRVGPEFEAEGSYESRSFDAQIFSQWGRLEWWSPRASDDGANSRSASRAKKSSQR